MITVTVLYPNKDGGRFDMNYYCNSHIPMVRRLLGAALTGVIVEQGLGGAAPGSKPTYMAIGQLRFDSVDAFQKAFAPCAEAIQKDVVNYTNAEPVIQISDVKLS